jgi:hypothetical protein
MRSPVRAIVLPGNITKCLQSRKLTHEKSRSWNEAGSQPILPRGKADDIGEVNRCMHPMGPPWQGTRQPRKDTQNNVEKVPLAAGAGSNLRRLLARGYCRRRGEAAGLAHEPV